jgi:hypothetical protein
MRRLRKRESDSKEALLEGAVVVEIREALFVAEQTVAGVFWVALSAQTGRHELAPRYYVPLNLTERQLGALIERRRAELRRMKAAGRYPPKRQSQKTPEVRLRMNQRLADLQALDGIRSAFTDGRRTQLMAVPFYFPLSVSCPSQLNDIG